MARTVSDPIPLPLLLQQGPSSSLLRLRTPGCLTPDNNNSIGTVHQSPNASAEIYVQMNWTEELLNGSTIHQGIGVSTISVAKHSKSSMHSIIHPIYATMTLKLVRSPLPFLPAIPTYTCHNEQPCQRMLNNGASTTSMQASLIDNPVEHLRGVHSQRRDTAKNRKQL